MIIKWARRLPADQVIKHSDEIKLALKEAEASGDAKKIQDARRVADALENEKLARNITKGVTKTQLDLADEAKQIAEELAKRTDIGGAAKAFGAGKKTTAAAKLEIDGQSATKLKSFSSNEPPTAGGDFKALDGCGFSKLPPESERLLKPHNLDEAGKINPAGRSRAGDAEVKLLEDVLARTKPNDKGTLNMSIFGPKSVCLSCIDVIEQFKKLRLGNKVEDVYHLPSK